MPHFLKKNKLQLNKNLIIDFFNIESLFIKKPDF